MAGLQKKCDRCKQVRATLRLFVYTLCGHEYQVCDGCYKEAKHGKPCDCCIDEKDERKCFLCNASSGGFVGRKCPECAHEWLTCSNCYDQAGNPCPDCGWCIGTIGTRDSCEEDETCDEEKKSQNHCGRCVNMHANVIKMSCPMCEAIVYRCVDCIGSPLCVDCFIDEGEKSCEEQETAADDYMDTIRIDIKPNPYAGWRIGWILLGIGIVIVWLFTAFSYGRDYGIAEGRELDGTRILNSVHSFPNESFHLRAKGDDDNWYILELDPVSISRSGEYTMGKNNQN